MTDTQTNESTWTRLERRFRGWMWPLAWFGLGATVVSWIDTVGFTWGSLTPDEIPSLWAVTIGVTAGTLLVFLGAFMEDREGKEDA